MKYRARPDSTVFVEGTILDEYPAFLASMHGLEPIPDDDTAVTTTDDLGEPPPTIPTDGQSTAMAALDLGVADVHTAGGPAKRIEGEDDAEEP